MQDARCSYSLDTQEREPQRDTSQHTQTAADALMAAVGAAVGVGGGTPDGAAADVERAGLNTLTMAHGHAVEEEEEDEYTIAQRYGAYVAAGADAFGSIDVGSAIDVINHSLGFADANNGADSGAELDLAALASHARGEQLRHQHYASPRETHHTSNGHETYTQAQLHTLEHVTSAGVQHHDLPHSLPHLHSQTEYGFQQHMDQQYHSHKQEHQQHQRYPSKQFHEQRYPHTDSRQQLQLDEQQFYNSRHQQQQPASITRVPNRPQQRKSTKRSREIESRLQLHHAHNQNNSFQLQNGHHTALDESLSHHFQSVESDFDPFLVHDHPVQAPSMGSSIQAPSSIANLNGTSSAPVMAKRSKSSTSRPSNPISRGGGGAARARSKKAAAVRKKKPLSTNDHDADLLTDLSAALVAPSSTSTAVVSAYSLDEPPQNQQHDSQPDRAQEDALLGAIPADPTTKKSHKDIERRRREAIAQGITDLAILVPDALNCKKGKVIEAAVEYIHLLREAEQQNIQKWTLEKMMFDDTIKRLSDQIMEARSSNQALREEIDRPCR
ncbi:hypothetical protein BC830DRAFT_1108102 [Chytriomyces sp. MP71]|nr:hypothetical protein BC830DRAFT_1108102 [Chytriomyces sp. MP71]